MSDLLWGSDLPWNVARQREDEAHCLVARIGRWAEHARAAAVDHGDTVLATVRRRALRHAPGSGTTLHPDVLDPELVAFAHRLLGVLGPCADHDRLDLAGNRVQVAVGTVALDLLGVWIDGEDLVATLPQALVH